MFNNDWKKSDISLIGSVILNEILQETCDCQVPSEDHQFEQQTELVLSM